jgi:hypothetical protein
MVWDHKHVRFQPTMNANRKRCGTTFHPNGPTISTNSPQTTARTHTPCKRTTPERATGPTVPFQSFLGTVGGGHPLYHKTSRYLCLGRRPILFGTVAYRLSRRNREIFGGRALVAPRRPMQQKRCSVAFWHYEALKTKRLQKMQPVGDTL